MMDIQALPSTCLPQAMRPPELDRHVRRKQFTSCDACRKLRRSCDAFSRGASPLQPPAVDSEILGCSACEKAGRKCTFQWLKEVPETALPRRLKRRRAPSSGHHNPALQMDPVKGQNFTSMYNTFPRPNLETWPANDTVYRQWAHADWEDIVFPQENYMNDPWPDTVTHDMWLPDAYQTQSGNHQCTNAQVSCTIPPDC